MQQKENKNFKLNDNFLSILLIVILSILFVFLLINFGYIVSFFKELLSILTPIIIGSVMAFITSPFYTKIHDFVFKFLSKKELFKSTKARHSFSKSVGVICSLLLWIILLCGFVFLVIPEIYKSTTQFMANLDDYRASIKSLYDNLEIPYLKEILDDSFNNLLNSLNVLFNDFQEYISNNFLSNLTNIIKNIYSGVMTTVGVIMNIGVGIIVMMYVLYKKEFIKNQLKKIVFATCKEETAKNIISELRIDCDIFIKFFIGKIIDSAIIFVLSYIVFRLMGVPYVFLLALIVGVTNIIPFFGPIVGGVIAAILVLFASPEHFIVFAIAVFLIQQFDGNVLGPKILGDATGVDNFYVLVAILIFGGLFGFIGMIIAVPMWAIIYRLVNIKLIKNLKAKNLPTNSKDYNDM